MLQNGSPDAQTLSYHGWQFAMMSWFYGAAAQIVMAIEAVNRW
jgi:hypothetical protein